MSTFATRRLTRRPARPHDAPHDDVWEKNLSHVGAHVALGASSLPVPADPARSTP
jgi:hypothetical protein